MSVSAVFNDGKLVETASQSSISSSNSSSMDKDAFLQLLVAQMKYQDPLEPTSNTEYISQYATFSELEQMQNMSATLELSRASSMVGQVVDIVTTTSTGEQKTVTGKVDYIVYENNKAYVAVEGELYSLDSVASVVDSTYQNAYELAVNFVKAMNLMPSVGNLTNADAEKVEALQTVFNSMNSYEQSFIANDYIEKLESYVKRMSELSNGSFNGAMDKLPELDELTAADKDNVESLEKLYNNMTEYEQGFIPEENVKKMQQYIDKMAELTGSDETE